MFCKTRLITFALATSASAAFALPAVAADRPFLDRFGSIKTIASAVPPSGPAKGDQNPYGIAVVPRSTGKLVKGDVLLSNFNDAANQQGTGSSIVELTPAGTAHVFAVVPRPTATPAVGLTTALVALRSGFVIVGSLPAPGGSAAAARAGALTVLSARGKVVETITAGDINGPWDMTALDRGTSATLFVTNVLNGTVAAKGKVVDRGTVVRITLSIGGGIPRMSSNRVIATGFGEHTDPNALVVGPTGVGLGANGVLYVADSNGNRIAAVPHALTRTSIAVSGGVTVSSGRAINDPLGLAIAPGGNILTVNGADGRIVETAPSSGRQLVVKTLVANGAGDLFGLAPTPGDKGLYFVDDAGSGPATNSLQMLR